ncbi:MAG: iron-sulfur cluster assembly scaffold protein [Desulfobacterales bacterium]|nr:iron-sulfur cluster assembly scaffold protein [Desulfobacterales bacterium]
MSQFMSQPGETGEAAMLAETGYSQTAIKYYMEKPNMREMADADQVSEFLGSCGDTMKVFLKIEADIIADASYQVLGCPGAISAAMAAVDLIKGKDLNFAKALNDGDIFKVLVAIPVKKHHCIQLAVKALHKAVDEYRDGSDETRAPDACEKDCDCKTGCPSKGIIS